VLLKKAVAAIFGICNITFLNNPRNHVKKFIATHYIMETGNSSGTLSETKFNYSNLSGSDNISSTPDLSATEKADIAEMQVSGRYKAAIIARNIDMDI